MSVIDKQRHKKQTELNEKSLLKAAKHLDKKTTSTKQHLNTTIKAAIFLTM